MKKLMAAMLLSVASTPVLAVDATPFFSVYGGAGSWSTEISGEVGITDTDVDDLGFDDEDNNFFYVGFSHAIPIIPNVRLEHTDITSSGSATLSETFIIGDEAFLANETVTTDIDLTFTDAILYYNIAILDFGLNIRQFDAEATAVAENGDSETEQVDGYLPMIYLNTKIDLPLTGLYVAGNVNTISYDDQSVTDYRAAVGYGIEISILAEIGLELGYRSLEIDLGEDEDLSADMDFSGAYFGLNVKF